MKKKTLIGMLFLMAVLAGAGAVGAQDVNPGRWWRDPGVSRDLSLTRQEQRELDSLYARNREELIDTKAELEKERSRLDDIMYREPFNEDAAKAQLRKVEEKRRKLTSERMRYLIEVRKILGHDRFRTLEGKAHQRMEWKDEKGRKQFDERPDKKGRRNW